MWEMRGKLVQRFYNQLGQPRRWRGSIDGSFIQGEVSSLFYFLRRLKSPISCHLAGWIKASPKGRRKIRMECWGHTDSVETLADAHCIILCGIFWTTKLLWTLCSSAWRSKSESNIETYFFSFLFLWIAEEFSWTQQQKNAFPVLPRSFSGRKWAQITLH